MDVALKEVADGKLGFEMLESEPMTPPVPQKKGRKAAAA
jgi:hypothetical protein